MKETHASEDKSSCICVTLNMRCRQPHQSGLEMTISPLPALIPSSLVHLFNFTFINIKLPKMSVGFGFSTGDFIAAIDLVGKVIDALRSPNFANL